MIGTRKSRATQFTPCLILLLALLPAGLAAQENNLVVTLVGTGGPELTPDRSGIATLIDLNGIQASLQYLLFDAGRSALENIYAARTAPQNVTTIFLTHLHNDHIEGLPSLWITPWFLLGRTAPLRVWGPPGTRNMIAGMRQMYAHDLEQRSNLNFKRSDLDIEVHEITEGIVYTNGAVQVMAIPVEHADGNPAFAYRVQAAGHTVFLTGDATLTSGLLAAAKGADVIISNVAAGTVALENSGSIQPVLAKLMRPEQAAELFTATAPRLAIFSHIVKKGLPGKAGDAEILRRTRRAGYRGPLRMGEDGMVISIGAKIRVRSAPSRQGLPDFDGPGSVFPVERK